MKEEAYYLWTTGKGLYVLLTLLMWGIFVSPLMIADGLMSDVIIESIFALILISGIFVTPCRPTTRIAMLVLALIAVFVRAIDKSSYTNFFIAVTDNVLASITLIAFSTLIVKHFLLSKTKLRYRIVAAVAVYLIFGVLFARLYEIVYLFNPSAFSLNETINPYSLIYFSFVTLMTLGYGDIVPLSMGARSLAILEGVVGQLYMVILISSLVSEFSALNVRSSKNEL